MTDEDLIHAASSSDLPRSGQLTAAAKAIMREVQLKDFGHDTMVDGEPGFTTTGPKIEALEECCRRAADAVIEECAKRIDELREKADAAGREIHATAYYRAAYALRSLKSNPKGEDHDAG